MSEPAPPQIAVIARVGAHRDFQAYGLNPHLTQAYDTPFGLSNPIHHFTYHGVDFVVLSRHGETGYQVSAPFVNDKANLYALKALGIEKVLAWCAPGAINEAMHPGDLVIPHDILDESRHGPYTFFSGQGQGFVRQNPVFCPELRQAIITALGKSSFPVHAQGLYVATTGPRLETPAEIRKYKLFGGDLVGMTLVPEIFLARELELCYTAICYVVNYAEGVKERPFKPGVLFEGLATPAEMARVQAVEAAFADLAISLLPHLAAASRRCPCPHLNERYRRRGDLDPDWRTWFR